MSTLLTLFAALCIASVNRIGTEHLVSAVDDYLRGVLFFESKLVLVLKLPQAGRVRWKLITPAFVVPILYVLSKYNDRNGIDRTQSFKLQQKCICRRTTGTPFRSEELDQDRLGRLSSGIGSTDY
jgi:hypothetical protein